MHLRRSGARLYKISEDCSDLQQNNARSRYVILHHSRSCICIKAMPGVQDVEAQLATAAELSMVNTHIMASYNEKYRLNAKMDRLTAERMPCKEQCIGVLSV